MGTLHRLSAVPMTRLWIISSSCYAFSQKEFWQSSSNYLSLCKRPGGMYWNDEQFLLKSHNKHWTNEHFMPTGHSTLCKRVEQPLQPIYKHKRSTTNPWPSHFIRQGYNLLGMVLFYEMIWLAFFFFNLPVDNAILAFMFRWSHIYSPRKKHKHCSHEAQEH